MSLSICPPGDLPAREFEAGQMSVSSHYPCPCGAPASEFPDAKKVLKHPPFRSIKDRMAHFGDTGDKFSHQEAPAKMSVSKH